MALPVLDRPEDALAEEAVLLGLERPVVDGLGLEDLAPRPPVAQAGHLQPLALLGVLRAADLLWRGDPHLDVVERSTRASRASCENRSWVTPRSRCHCRRSATLSCSAFIREREPELVRTHADMDAERLELLHEHVERLRGCPARAGSDPSRSPRTPCCGRSRRPT